MSRPRRRLRLLARRARRWIVHDVLHADDPPHRLALGLAIGIFCAFVPAFGIQMLLVVLFAWMLGANKLVGTPLVWITNPLTVVPIYYASYIVGAWVLGEPPIEDAWWAQWAHPPAGFSAAADFYWARMFEVGWPLILGSIVLGLAAAVPTYFCMLYAIRAYRLRRWGQLTPPDSENSSPAIS